MHDNSNNPQPNQTQASDSAAAAKENLRNTAQNAGEAVKQEYQTLKDEAMREGEAVMKDAEHQAEAYAEAQRRSAAANASAVARAIRAGAQDLEEQGKDSFAQYTKSAADGVDQASQWLENKSWGEVWREAEHFARRQPLVTFGGALGAGFLLARFLKSTTDTTNNDRPSDATESYQSTGMGIDATAAGAQTPPDVDSQTAFDTTH